MNRNGVGRIELTWPCSAVRRQFNGCCRFGNLSGVRSNGGTRESGAVYSGV